MAVLGNADDFAPELKMLLLEPIHEFPEYGPETRHYEPGVPDEEPRAARNPGDGMRFRSLRPRVQSQGIEMRQRRPTPAARAPAANAWEPARLNHRFSVMRQVTLPAI